MSSFSFSVNEGQSLAETISVDTTGATSATVKFSKRLTGTYTTIPGAAAILGTNKVTVTIDSSIANSSYFPAYFYVDLDNASQAIKGTAEFIAATAQAGQTAHTHPESDITSLVVDLGGKVSSSDSRLSDARTPTAHGHAQTDVTGLGTSLSAKIDSTDARLTDARTPTAHQHGSVDLTSLPSHSHAQTDVTNLATALSGKVDSTDSRLKTYLPGLIGNRPTPAAFGTGWYFATDQNTGTLYYSDGSTWTQQAAGVSWASGTQLAYAESTSVNLAVTGVGSANAVDVPALAITVPASSVPVTIQGRILGSQGTGSSAAVGTFNGLVLSLTDAANNPIDFYVQSAIQANLANHTWYQTFNVETRIPAPFAGGTYKLRAYLLFAAATGWSANMFSTSPTWPKAFIEAVAH